MTNPKKAKYVTRNEAAEILEVHPQSITNYAERGFLRTVRAKTNDFTYFIREEVEALKPEISDIIDKEKAIEKYRKVIEEEAGVLWEAVKEQRSQLEAVSVRTNYVRELIHDIYCILEHTEDSEPIGMLLRLLAGDAPKDVAKDYEVSVGTMQRRCTIALRTLSFIPDYAEMCCRKEKAESDYRIMAASYERLSEQYELLKILYQETKGIKSEDPNVPP